MIVSCQQCGTSFQLDESRVPVSGIRVRCSRCKQAFFLEHPDASQSERAHEVASEMAEAGGAPGTTQDLPTRGDHVGPETTQTVGSELEEEDDWEFNEDFPSTADDASFGDSDSFDDGDSPGRDEDVFAHGEVGFGDLGDGNESLELDVGDAGEPAGAGPAAAPDAGDETSAFGSVEDYSELMEDDAASADTGVVRELADEAPADLSAEPQRAPTRSRSEELGDPEDWDFFSDESLETVGTGVTEEAVDPGVVEAWGALEQKMARAPAGGPKVAAGGEGTKGLNERLEQVGAVLGWVCTLALIAVGVTQGLVSGSSSHAFVRESVPVGDMIAEGVEGHWLDTARMGSVFIVTGQLRNPGAQHRPVRGNLQVALLDAEGVAIGHPPAPMGVEIGRRTLREGAPGDLREVQLRASRRLGQASLAPGAVVDVMAVFPELPEQAMRFDIEIVADALPQPPPAPVAPAAEVQSSSGVEEGAALPTAPTPSPTPAVQRIPLPSGGS